MGEDEADGGGLTVSDGDVVEGIPLPDADVSQDSVEVFVYRGSRVQLLTCRSAYRY